MRLEILASVAWLIIKRMGRSSATSISKIRNTTARRKKRSEKGIRAEFFGSNPHSNGVAIFRCDGARIDTVSITSVSAAAIISAMKTSRANFTI